MKGQKLNRSPFNSHFDQVVKISVPIFVSQKSHIIALAAKNALENHARRCAKVLRQVNEIKKTAPLWGRRGFALA
ncbi:MAG: hypothetical protein AAFQ10_01765 [Pseudomonadota bacterium]